MNDQVVIANEAACPRCGYDQQGAHEAWQKNLAPEGERACCPVRGVCSECGLEFAWGSVLNPELAATNWLFEHVKGRRRVPRTSWRNGWSSLLAWRWWKRVRMEHAVRPWRLAVHWVVWLLVAEAALGVIQSLGSMWMFWWYSRQNAAWGGQTFRMDEMFTSRLLDTGLTNLLWPWGSFNLRARAYGGYGAFDAGDILTINVLLPVLMAGAFLLLPVTMRRMRVRKVHLMRGIGHAASAALCGFAVWVAVVTVLTCFAMTRPFWNVDIGLLGPPDRLLFTALAVWLFTGLWWWRFTRDYLRLPRAGWVAGLLFVIALLAAVLACRPVQEGVVWAWDWVAWQTSGVRVRMGL
ncbi:MAG: hypothetical protein QM783_19190 [Phycisphaerales bacterium]